MNRLAEETSPYLLQHAGNPVDWYPWGEEARRRAHDEDKPIFLSVGYSACHWCHVMERESFEDPTIAALMNEHFVNVKVDREERPDVDALYMEAAVSMNGNGGWPLSLFLTPDGRPFWAATYMPPVARHGMRSFPDVLAAIAEVWRSKREEIERTSESIAERLRSTTRLEPSEEEIDASVLSGAVESLMMTFDWSGGGWGAAPKFPQPSALEFLMRHGVPPTMVERTLDAMAAGGMYDLVGGGFHRYSVDERWLVPHFEKMLDDNAQLAGCYLHAWLLHGKERYREVAEQTVDYMLRELGLPDGGFASSQDADTDGSEGLTYTWTRAEGVPDPLLHIFEGNRFVVRGELDPELRAELLAARAQRRQPGRDDKVIVAWNGLALASLAECARHLDRPDWLAAASRLAEFLLGPLSRPDGRLHRTWREGSARGEGYLEDYANLASGLIELHAASGELRWLEEARRIADVALELFFDPERGGFFETPSDGEELIARRKSFEDHPSPSGNAMIALVLLRLGRIYGDPELEERARSVFRLVRGPLSRAPIVFAYSLVGIDFLLSPPREIAIVGPPDAPVARAALHRFEPHAVVAFGPSEAIPLLEGKTLVDGRPAVYVCQRFSCQAPVTDPAELRA